MGENHLEDPACFLL